ncbi:hypothetical protein COT20_01680 [bacterium (Candidatus Gribaldobacteria) CG08_land_8_20_14_0_20_39_15]|uniref:Metal-dependent hydrolase n=1 Tax=bacterium (Candidatus Gribaldobacteria) CG08_land_8_20_14_0_20_39_15 TaxID=2014273 RepID=A0A2M6XUG0_9BACT|nr:MAG: hypothetical protein COT20_01680 [bacterium (Candidatus Gribaldobacteria) CG08_land_8_20_14_0_20_39_15]
MKPMQHLIFSGILGLGFLIFIRPFWAALIAFSSGIFIDLDHLIDFWALKPAKPFNVKDFLHSEKYNCQKKWLFVFLHNWESIIGLWLWAYFGHWSTIVTALAAGLTLHLIMDIANLRSYKMHPFAYFLIFRLIKGFKKDEICYENNC